MNTLIAAALAFFQTQSAEPLDLRWIKGIGTFELSTPGGPNLIVTVRDPGGVEKRHEITFRRGSTKPGKLDERIFVDICPSAIEPLQPGFSRLMTVAASE